MDYIFVVPDSPKFDHFIREHMFFKHQRQISPFTFEKLVSLSFLNVKIYWNNEKCGTSVYRKPAFGGFSTNYESFIATNQKKDFYIHKSVEVSTYVVISRHFIRISII